MEILSLEQRSLAPIRRVPILCRHTNSVEKRKRKKIFISLSAYRRSRTYYKTYLLHFL